MKEESHNNKKILYTGIKILILILGALWLFYNWKKEQTFGFLYFVEILQNINWLYFAPSILFYLINWSIETIKWQLLMKRTEEFTFKRGLSAVFAGTTASAIIPYKMGSYLGRMLFLRTPFKIRAIPASILGNLLQSSITFFVGLFAAFTIVDFSKKEKSFYIIFALAFFLLLATLPFYYKKLADFINKGFKKIVKTKKYRLFSLYERKTIGKAWVYSFLRYCAFTLHFVFILKAFHIDVSITDLILCVSTIYFLQSFTPSFIVLDFGVKASIALGIFTIYTAQEGRLNNILIFHYLLNSIVPILLGAIGILFLRIRNK